MVLSQSRKWNKEKIQNALKTLEVEIDLKTKNMTNKDDQKLDSKLYASLPK